MEKSCCALGNALFQERLLFETPNFFAIPTKGSFGIRGYLLIVTKNHYHGFGEIPEKDYAELNELRRDLKKIINIEYGLSTTTFEHGPRIGNLDSGQSIDHAHLHIIPGVDITKEWAIDLMMRTSQRDKFYRVESIEGFERAREMLSSGDSYLYMESPDGIERMSSQNFVRPSQYFRYMSAQKIGSDKGDWRRFPDYKTMVRTIEDLRKYFH